MLVRHKKGKLNLFSVKKKLLITVKLWKLGQSSITLLLVCKRGKVFSTSYTADHKSIQQAIKL